MITELTIEGFKSFGSPAETIELGPLNVVVGANASGKTNLLSALRFLQNAVTHDVSYAVSEMGGNAEVRNKRLRQRHEPKPMRLSLKLGKEFGVSPPVDPDEQGDLDLVRSFEYQLVLDLRSDDRAPSIEAESLRAELVHRGATSTLELERAGREVVVIDPTSDSGASQTIPVPEQEPTRLALVGVGFFSLPATILREEIRGWRFHPSPKYRQTAIPGRARCHPRSRRREARPDSPPDERGRPRFAMPGIESDCARTQRYKNNSAAD